MIAASRRTRITYPDGFYAVYDHDTLGSVTAIRENGAVSVGVLATLAYDDLLRRSLVTRGNGTVTSYGYDAVSRHTGLTQNLNGAGHDNVDTFGHTPASQTASFTRSNDAVYAWRGAVNGSKAYADNGLNQYTAVAGVAQSHSARALHFPRPGGMESAGQKAIPMLGYM